MHCHCCQSKSIRKAFVKNNYTILKCANCGLGLLDPQEQRSLDLAAIYDSGYFSGQQNDGYADYAGSEQVLRAEFRRTLKHILGKISQGNLLELGCAYGFFLKEASSHFQCSGLELCDDAVLYCRGQGLAVQQGVADSSHIAQHGPQDVVVMLDVIEHLPDPEATLQAVYENLRPKGVVYITTGDWGSLLARLTGPNWRLMTPPQHLSYFTQPAMRSLLTRIGFNNVTISKPWKFVPLGLVIYQLMRLLGLNPSKPPAVLNRLGLYLNLFDSMAVTAVK